MMMHLPTGSAIRRIVSFVATGAALFVGAATYAQEAAWERGPESSAMTGQIIDAIEDFEAQKDAKCYATATRLENFIYGSPLSDEARYLKIDLQKQIINQVWKQASAAAAGRGADRVTADDIRPALKEVLSYREMDSKDIEVTLPDGQLTLGESDFRHYSSIAYALRAILAVQQDQILSTAAPLLPLDEEAVDAIRETLDVLTLTVLALADQEARTNDEAEISADRFSTAWLQVVSPAPRTTEPVPAVATEDSSPALSLALFRAIVNQKIKSYEVYNQIDAQARSDLFLANVRRYYARYQVPPGGLTLPDGLGREAEDFLGRVLELAHASAEAHGERLIRASDLNDALLEVTPHSVDDLEDVTYFPRLPQEQQVVLAAFDLDSFRDFGMHWRLLEIMLDLNRIELTREPDPFAAELIAEGLAQYAVLVLRLAGQIARSDNDTPFVDGTHLRRAAEEIRRRAAADRDAPPREQQAAPIRSAHGSRDTGDGAFMTDFTQDSGIVFEHRSSDWLNRFRHDISMAPPTFTGGGIAAGDVNGDGRSDLLFVGGIGNALYLNNDKGHFVQSPHNDGVQFSGHDGLPGEARQPIIADFDNDGDQDILITYVFSEHKLLRNVGGGEFEDVSERAMLGGERQVSGPATVFDYDRDGLLDLYICYFGNYLKGYSGSGTIKPGEFVGDVPALRRHNDNGLPNRLFRNLGDMRFEEVAKSGTADTGWCQAVSHTDFDGDGYQDLIVANDFGRNALLRNLHTGRFEDVAASLGLTKTYHSMNVGLADLNADQLPDLYISNINMMVKDNRYVLPSETTPLKIGLEQMAGVQIVEASMLYMSAASNGTLNQYEVSDAVERTNAVGWAWDAEFFDYDNDGDDDLYVLNGTNEYFVELAVHDAGEGGLFEWNMDPNVFYVNDGGKLRNMSQRSGADFAGNSRSAAYLDFDDDGDLDVAINNFQGPAAFFRNNLAGPDTNWIRVKLEGKPDRGSNRDAIGARILASTSDGKQIWREIHGGSGFLSMEPKVQHIGLGGSAAVDLVIRWPNGQIQESQGLDANRTWLIREDEPAIQVTTR